MAKNGKVPWVPIAGVAGVVVVGVGVYYAYKATTDIFKSFNDLMGKAGDALKNAAVAIQAIPGQVGKGVQNQYDIFQQLQNPTSELNRPDLYKKTTVTTYTPSNPAPPGPPVVHIETEVEKALETLMEMDTWIPATKYTGKTVKNVSTWRDAMNYVFKQLSGSPKEPKAMNDAAFFIQEVKAKFPTHYSSSKAGCAYNAQRLYGAIMSDIITIESSGNPQLYGALGYLHEAAGYVQQALGVLEGK
jgi:hypothetical protein